MLKLSEMKIRVHAKADLRRIKYFTEPAGFNLVVTFYKEKSFKTGYFVAVDGSLSVRARGRYYMKNRTAYLEEELPVYYK